MRPLKVLIACEMSGIVREEFTKLGCDAWSCDILDTEIPGQHYKGDIFDFLDSTRDLDLMIAHPSCDYLANSGQRWMFHPDDSKLPECRRRVHPMYPNRHLDQVRAIDFFARLQERDEIPHVCIENPIPQAPLRRCVGRYDDLIQPWQFGEEATKATCLWLKDLPKLVPTDIVPKDRRKALCHKEAPGPMRKVNRSRTYPGIARAWAKQYSEYITERRNG
jgi:hypothetical protein